MDTSTLLQKHQALTIRQLAMVCGTQLDEFATFVDEQIRRERLFTVTYHVEKLIPMVQFDNEHHPRLGVAIIARPLLKVGMDPWHVWEWLVLPRTDLGGKSPAQAMLDDTEKVYRLALEQARASARITT